MDGMIVSMVDTSPSDNIEDGAPTKRSFHARIASLGKAEGLGDNSRPGLFLVTCEASCGGNASAVHRKRVVESPDEAEDIFDRYSKQVAMTQGVGWKPQASAKQQVSKLRTAIKLGLLTHVNGMELCNKVVEAQKALKLANDGLDYSPFDGLVKVARFQLQQPDKILDDDVIGGLLLKPAGDVPEEADRLEKVVKQMEKLIDAKDDPVSEESIEALTEAAGSLMTRIRELGGSTGMRKQADKAKEAAAKAQAEASSLVDRHRAAVARLTQPAAA